jgi:hypothetical protein
MPRGRVCVFIGYSETTAKQFKVYTLDLGYTTRSAVVDWDENTLGGTVDLKIRGLNPQGTPNELLPRNPAGRPKKPELEEESIPMVTLLPPEGLNNFDIVILVPTSQGGNVLGPDLEPPTPTSDLSRQSMPDTVPASPKEGV